MTSFSDLQSGFAKNLLPLFAESPRNHIIFVERPKPGSLAEKVLKKTSPIHLEVRKKCFHLILSVSSSSFP